MIGNDAWVVCHLHGHISGADHYHHGGHYVETSGTGFRYGGHSQELLKSSNCAQAEQIDACDPVGDPDVNLPWGVNPPPPPVYPILNGNQP